MTGRRVNNTAARKPTKLDIAVTSLGNEIAQLHGHLSTKVDAITRRIDGVNRDTVDTNIRIGRIEAEAKQKKEDRQTFWAWVGIVTAIAVLVAGGFMFGHDVGQDSGYTDGYREAKAYYTNDVEPLTE